MVSRRSHLDARPNRLAEAVDRRRAGGRPYLDLTRSNPTTAGIPYDHAALRVALSGAVEAPYEPSPMGLLSARAAIAHTWRARGLSVSPSRIVLTASTSEAYAFLLKALCDPGDEVLVPTPSYPLFEHLVRYEGVVPVPYALAYDGAWHVDAAAVASRVTERTRAVIVVSPNNPTGSIVKRDELVRLSALGLPIVSDEVFGEYRVSPGSGAVTSMLEQADAVVFALDGLSKLAALPQMKLAWITVGGPDARVRETLDSLELIADTFLSPSGPVQRALPAILQASTVSREAVRERIAANVGVLVRACEGSAVTPLPVEGGWSVVARLPAVVTEEAWVLGLLETEDVLVQPGWFYDFPAEAYVVASLLSPEAEFAEGVRRLVRYVTETA